MDETKRYFSTLECVRETCGQLLLSPQHLKYFDLDLSSLPKVIEMVMALIKRDYDKPNDIPPHSRWRHFEPGSKDRIGKLLKGWEESGVDLKERVKRILDLFIVSVLLDAGAGPDWKYEPRDEPSMSYNRSEGLALASLDWFTSGGLSSDVNQPYRVDSIKLKALTDMDLISAFQVNDKNPLVGIERVGLLARLGQVIEKFDYFSSTEPRRPGNLLDYLENNAISNTQGKTLISIDTLWEVVMVGLSGVWPSTRTSWNGSSLGDVWPCYAMASISKDKGNRGIMSIESIDSKSLVAFHKLSQWMTYSLLEPLSLIGMKFTGLEKMTGLAEYRYIPCIYDRNGGVFVDTGVLKLKAGVWTGSGLPRFEVHSQEIIEWRALTVALLDKVGAQVRLSLGMTAEELPLVKVLEAGTWKAGREIAAKLRPDKKGPPIEIISDGTLF